MSVLFTDHILAVGVHADLPVAADTPYGALFSCTDHNKIYRNNAGTWGDWATLGGAGGGGLVLVDDQTVTGAAVTSVTLAGLDGDVDKIYCIKFRFVKAVAATTILTLEPNGLTTNQASWTQFFGSSSGSSNSAVLDIDRNGAAAAGEIAAGEVWIDAETGEHRTFIVSQVQHRGAADFFHNIFGVWSDNAANITDIDVVCSVASGIDVGSYFRIYKLAN